SSGIAQRETEALGPLIRRIREQLSCSVLIIEHDIPLINDLADHMVALDLGTVVTVGTPDEVLNDPYVVESDLGTARPSRAGPRRGRGHDRRTRARQAPTGGPGSGTGPGGPAGRRAPGRRR